MGAVRVTVAVVVTALAVVGCSGRGEVPASPSRPTPTAVSVPLREATWTNGEWPFTVAEGVLKCYADDSMVTFTAAGIEYGYNDTAIRFGGFPSIAEILPEGRAGYVEVNGERQPVLTPGRSLDGFGARVRDACY